MPRSWKALRRCVVVVAIVAAIAGMLGAQDVDSNRSTDDSTASVRHTSVIDQLRSYDHSAS
jgi:hypothetical protein